MKKAFSLLLAVLCLFMTAAALGGCGGGAVSGRPTVVVTVFPLYDWTRNLLGDAAGEWDLVLLADDGADLHSYSPTADDMIRIASCDLFIHVGGESDGWVVDALRSGGSSGRAVLDLCGALRDLLREEETVEGMQSGGEEDDGGAFDEHIWLSPRLASEACAKIADALTAADPAHADCYRQACEAYRAELAALDDDYREAAGLADAPVLLFADRFPFLYPAKEYGISYFAAFSGCSAESEASFETVAFLAGKIDELHLKHVMILETSDGKLARTVIGASKAKDADVLTLDSMQARADGDYLTIMKKNLEVLRAALS